VIYPPDPNGENLAEGSARKVAMSVLPTARASSQRRHR
jgi:hypothetical protein